MDVAERLSRLGIVLPDLAPPVANYLPVVVDGSLASVSGQLPRDSGLVQGQVGVDLSVEQARAAARLCGIAIVSVLHHMLDGGLDRVARCLHLTGYVNAPSGFSEHPAVINGASDLMVELFGDAGRHSRAAVGCSSLPLNAAVEIAATFVLKPSL